MCSAEPVGHRQSVVSALACGAVVPRNRNPLKSAVVIQMHNVQCRACGPPTASRECICRVLLSFRCTMSSAEPVGHRQSVVSALACGAVHSDAQCAVQSLWAIGSQS